MNLNLHDLYVFVQVVDHGGFAAAARALGLPKSTLSRRVAVLETNLGVRLLNRSSRTFEVTDIGAEFYECAANAVAAAQRAEQVVKGRLPQPSGTALSGGA